MPILSWDNYNSDRWEITLQDLPAPITKITLSANGLYIEAGQRWDLLPWPELAALIDDEARAQQAGAAKQERQALLQRIMAMHGVVAMSGPMPPPVRIAYEPESMW
jgi:hypothetical protein